MKCIRCGKSLEENEYKCQKCGFNLLEDSFCVPFVISENDSIIDFIKKSQATEKQGFSDEMKPVAPKEEKPELQDEADIQAARKVSSLIKDLHTEGDVTKADLESIKNAREEYDALSEKQKGFLNQGDIDQLLKAEEWIEKSRKRNKKVKKIVIIALAAVIILNLFLFLTFIIGGVIIEKNNKKASETEEIKTSQEEQQITAVIADDEKDASSIDDQETVTDESVSEKESIQEKSEESVKEGEEKSEAKEEKKEEPKSKSLTSLTSIEYEPRTTSLLTDNYGNQYNSAIINDIGSNGAGPVIHEFLINSQYDRLTGTLYIPEGETSDDFSTFSVKGDGFLLYASPAMDKTSRPIDIDVDISGFNDLVIEWCNNSNHNLISDLKCCLANAKIYSEGQNQEKSIDNTELPIMLADLKSIENDVQSSFRLRDTRGNTYSSAIDDSKKYEFLLNEKYSRFECTLYIPENASFKDSIVMKMVADGNEIYVSPEMSVTSEPVNVSVNLTGCNDLQISFLNNNRVLGWDKILCLGNAYVYMEGNGEE